MANRTTKESEEHDRTVGLTAQTRFEFPSADHPKWKTYTNHPAQTMGVTKRDGTVVYPDIVVVETPNNTLQMIGEIETSMTVTDDEASREWRSYASIGTVFYLYVPNEMIATAREMLTRYSINIAGLRGYYYDARGVLNIVNY